MYGDDIQRFTCNVHHDFDGDGFSESCSFAQSNTADFTQWHTFTCLFDFDKITWLIDGSIVRILHRYSTVSGIPISCGENIGTGIYFQEQSYPIEYMNIVMNLSIQSGSKAPDSHTIFPNTYEIDYVRFYIKSDQPPCDGCLVQIEYEDTNQLPTLTRAKNHIHAGTLVTVKNDQIVSFKAPSINLSSGFSTEHGATFLAISEECNIWNYDNVDLDFIGNNAINNYEIDKCVNPIYNIEVNGLLFYSFTVHNQLGQLVHSISGAPSSNQINLWNVTNVASAWYSAQLVLLNCSDNDTKNYNLLVSQASCRIANSSDTSQNQLNAVKHDNEKEISTFNK